MRSFDQKPPWAFWSVLTALTRIRLPCSEVRPTMDLIRLSGPRSIILKSRPSELWHKLGHEALTMTCAEDAEAATCVMTQTSSSLVMLYCDVNLKFLGSLTKGKTPRLSCTLFAATSLWPQLVTNSRCVGLLVDRPVWRSLGCRRMARGSGNDIDLQGYFPPMRAELVCGRSCADIKHNFVDLGEWAGDVLGNILLGLMQLPWIHHYMALQALWFLIMYNK